MTLKEAIEKVLPKERKPVFNIQAGCGAWFG